MYKISGAWPVKRPHESVTVFLFDFAGVAVSWPFVSKQHPTSFIPRRTFQVVPFRVVVADAI
jgi:hypothetical protein